MRPEIKIATMVMLNVSDIPSPIASIQVKKLTVPSKNPITPVMAIPNTKTTLTLNPVKAIINTTR